MLLRRHLHISVSACKYCRIVPNIKRERSCNYWLSCRARDATRTTTPRRGKCSKLRRVVCAEDPFRLGVAHPSVDFDAAFPADVCWIEGYEFPPPPLPRPSSFFIFTFFIFFHSNTFRVREKSVKHASAASMNVKKKNTQIIDRINRHLGSRWFNDYTLKLFFPAACSSTVWFTFKNSCWL